MTAETFFLVLAAGLVVFLFSSLFMVFAGFRERWYWGVLVLLIPVIGMLGFMMLQWKESRYPFFGMILGVMISVIGVFGGGYSALSQVAYQAGFSIEDVLQDYPDAQEWLKKRPSLLLVENEQAVIDAGIDTSITSLEQARLDELEEVEIVPLSEAPVEMVKELIYDFFEITAEEVPTYFNRRIRVTTNTGKVYDGTLRDSDEYYLSMDQVVTGGMVTFDHRFDSINKIEIYGVVGEREIKTVDGEVVLDEAIADDVETPIVEPQSTTETTPPANGQ